ncbi:MAG: LysR family transcriptional regulator [Leptolyngbya sp. SIO1D8]|nr:LysR family transcriptional regulator [Leptolyngbya sp. SIO1D8]
MEFRQLQYFVAVAEELHFGRAADRLEITQPALSKQILGLEAMLGVQLLFRTKRTVKLTHAGQTFLNQARQLLLQKETAIQLTRRTGCGDIGQLRIGFTKTATQTVLPQVLREFLQHYPKVEIDMLELATEAQVMALNQDTINLAFLHPPIDQRGLKLHPILEESFFAVLPPQHPLVRHNTLAVEAFANEPLIVHPRQEGPILYDAFLQVCQMAGFQPRIVKESISLQTRLCLVSAGIGITFISDYLRSLIGPDVVCRPLENCPIRLKFGAAWRQNLTNPTLHNILNILIEKTQIYLEVNQSY